MSSTSKLTGRDADPHRRGSGDASGAALDLVADRWSMWLLVELGEQDLARFTDLASAPGLSRRVLAERLARLVDAGLIERRRYSTRPARHHYRLTARGQLVSRAAGELLRSVSAAPDAQATSGDARGQDLLPTLHPASELLAADPGRSSRIIDDTVLALVRYDDQYRTSLVETLRVYLECDASTSRAAARLYAHRHTVRYRLTRVRELSGLDVDVLADREQLVLGLRALAIARARGDVVG